MSRKKRNDSIKRVLDEIGVTWKELRKFNPPKELVAFVETTKVMDGVGGLGMKRGTLMSLWNFRAIQEKGWGDWVITSILVKIHAQLSALMNFIKTSGDSKAEGELFKGKTDRLRGRIKILLKEIRTPEGLKGMHEEKVMDWLEGRELFEALHGLEIKRFHLEEAVTDIVIQRVSGLTTSQKKRIAIKLLNDKDQYERAIRDFGFDEATKKYLMSLLDSKSKGVGSGRPYGV